MGSTICLEHRHHQNDYDDVYDILFGGKSDNKKENLQVTFYIDDYFYKKSKRKKRKKRKNNHLNK